MDVLLYGTPMNIRSAPAWTAYTSEGKFRFEGISLDSYIDWELKVLVKDGEMIAVRETVSDSVTCLLYTSLPVWMKNLFPRFVRSLS